MFGTGIEGIFRAKQSRKKLRTVQNPFTTCTESDNAFYACLFLGGRTLSGNCEIYNISTFSFPAAIGAVKAEKLYVSYLIYD